MLSPLRIPSELSEHRPALPSLPVWKAYAVMLVVTAAVALLTSLFLLLVLQRARVLELEQTNQRLRRQLAQVRSENRRLSQDNEADRSVLRVREVVNQQGMIPLFRATILRGSPPSASRTAYLPPAPSHPSIDRR